MATRHRLSDHFVIEEFDSHDGRHVPTVLVPGIRLWCELWGEPMRRSFGTCTVLSGYRSAAHNKAVGGAEHSVHLGASLLPHSGSFSKLRAAAGDVKFQHGTVRDWHRKALELRDNDRELSALGRGGIGLYVAQGFLHLDTWTLRNWRG